MCIPRSRLSPAQTYCRSVSVMSRLAFVTHAHITMHGVHKKRVRVLESVVGTYAVEKSQG